MVNITKSNCDLGIDIDGTRNGPIEIVKNLNTDNIKLFSINIDHKNKSKNESDLRKNITRLNKFNSEQYNLIKNMNKNDFNITIGGDHSIAISSALASSFKYKNIGIIWIDAHLDYNTFDTTITGNLHGLPLAAINGLCSDLTKFNEDIFIDPKNTVVVGYRSLEPNKELELNNAKKSGITIFDNEYIKNNGIEKTMMEAIKIASYNTNGIHISYDLDIIDEEYAPGVSVPEKDGINYNQAMEITDILCKNLNLIKSFDLVEYNPLNDIDNKTLNIAIEILNKIIKEKDII